MKKALALILSLLIVLALIPPVSADGATAAAMSAAPKDGDRVVIVEDVTTSGKSMEETVPILRAQADVNILGLMVSLDRGERGQDSEHSALSEVSQRYGFPTAAIVTMKEVTEILAGETRDGTPVITDEIRARIDAYYAEYGAR